MRHRLTKRLDGLIERIVSVDPTTNVFGLAEPPCPQHVAVAFLH